MTMVESSSAIPQDNFTISSDQLKFRFGNLCGSPYSGGSVVFSSDGTCLFSPVSNRVQMTDLSGSRSWVCRLELRSTADLIVPMPSSKLGKIVLGIDEDGYGILLECGSGAVLNRINFKGRVNAAAFSKDGRYLATATGRRIKVWHSASVENNWQFVPMRQFAGHIGDVSSLEFANSEENKPDLLLSAGADSIVRVWSLNYEEAPHSILNEQTQSIVGAFFFNGRDSVIAVNRAGNIILWSRKSTTSTEFEVSSKAHIPGGVGYVRCASFDALSGMMCLGLSGGVFSLYSVTGTSMEPAQSLSVGSAVTSVSMAPGGDWVAVGVEEAGQLIVWEWRAENFILRQQGHHDGVNCVAFCPITTSNKISSDLLEVFSGSATFSAGGGLIATGGVEGKLKLWHSVSGFCFVTFSDHTSSVEAVLFTPQGNAVVSASMDGSVRAYDLLRYKNFRTFAAPDARVQFGSLAIDSSGDVLAAGSANGNYNIYLWSMQTGQCLDVLAGHEARISYLCFAPSGNDGILASTSWDSTMKVWDVFARKGNSSSESLMNQREVTCCAFDPVDGTIAAVATLSGHITFWDTRSGGEVGSIDAIRDIGSGRKDGERFSSGALKGKRSKKDGSGLNVNLNQYFSAIEYGGAAGRWLAAVSKNSVFACIYDPLEKVLISRIELTTHWGLSGIKQFLNSKFDSDLVPDDGYDELDPASKRIKKLAAGSALPGVVRGDMKLTTKSKKVWRVNGLGISADGQEMAIATSEGVFLLTLNSIGEEFNPTELGEEVSIGSIMKSLKMGDFKRACKFSLQLNDSETFEQIFSTIVAREEIQSVISSIAPGLFLTLLRQLSHLVHPVEGSCHIERCVVWLNSLITLHFNSLQKLVHQTSQGRDIRAVLCTILQHIQTQTAALGSLFKQNCFDLAVLAKPYHPHHLHLIQQPHQEEDGQEEEGISKISDIGK